MSLATLVKREQSLTLTDIEEIRDFRSRLIDSFLYEKLSRAKKGRVLFYVKRVDEWLKENAERVLKSEFAVKPIKIFPSISPEKNHEKYERYKKKKENGSTTDSTGLSEGMVDEIQQPPF